MEQKWGYTWRPTVNEKMFIEEALHSDLRVDGRRPFDYRKLTIKFGREDGSSEVQLGETHVMAYVTGQLVQPYRDRSSEGTLAIYTEFSPMADPSFESGRPGEAAIELGRVIDRGLRESRAVDMESLCVVAGRSVWALRVDLHIIDNGGNLIDAANIAALAALSTFRRPECTVGGQNGQEIVIHDPEVWEPIPLTIHHLPIAVTFAFFSKGNLMVIDPTYKEEWAMEGRMTATVNSNGEICSIQKPGGDGVLSSVILQCLRIASLKSSEITSKIKSAVESYNTERALRKVKRHPLSVTKKISVPDSVMSDANDEPLIRLKPQNPNPNPSSSISGGSDTKSKKSRATIGGPLKWDPYSGGNSSDLIASSQSTGIPVISKEQNEDETMESQTESNPEIRIEENSAQISASGGTHQQNISPPKSLIDAVKPKNKRRKNKSARDAS